MRQLTASAGTKSKLAKPVQELIKMIFDVESMKKAMVEFEVRHLFIGATGVLVEFLFVVLPFSEQKQPSFHVTSASVFWDLA